MDPERFRRVRQIFDQAVALSEVDRVAFLDAACGDDLELRQEVERLLRHDLPGSESTVAGPAPAPPSGHVGPYRLIRVLGEGGMGVVWEAFQERPVERTVALKVIKHGLDGQHVLARFESERQALALMNHPNVARVLDAGTDDAGRPWFAMDYIRGVPLTDYCDRNNLTTSERLALFLRVCEGVQHAHQKGIIHRDLKPSNVLVELQEGRPVPRIIDFGVAKALERRLTERTLFTEFGQIVGTPEYMSPEQAEMTGLEVDTRTDVYSLGVMLYELLTGALPFDPQELRRAGYDEIRRRIREETPPKPSTRLSTMGDASDEVARHRGADASTLVRLCRGDLDWITMKALEKDQARRYGAASDLAGDIRRHLANEPVSAGPPSASYRLQKFVRRHRAGVAIAALLVAVVLAGFAGTAYGLVRAREAEQRARLEADTLAEVSDFMVGMFEISDPSEARGAIVTAREVLDRASDRIRIDLGERPAMQGRLMEVMGRVYRSLGLYGDSQPLLEGAVRRLEQAHGPDAPELARALDTLGALAIMRGETDEAESLCRRALAIQDRVLPPDHVDRARVLNNLGNVERLRKRYAEAKPYYQEALTIRERVFGPEHAEVAKMVNQLGLVEIRTEEYDLAREHFARSLAIYERVRGPDHPDLTQVLNNIAQLERKAGRLDAAREASSRAIAIQEKVLPPAHPDRVNTLFERAMIERDAGDLDAARSAIDRALAIAEGPPPHRLLENVSELRTRLAAGA